MVPISKLWITIEPGFSKWQNGKFLWFSNIFIADKSTILEWFYGKRVNVLDLVDEMALL